MEAREMNLMDLANRIEKIIFEAEQNRNRITEAGDILLGSQPCNPVSGSSTMPSPVALIQRLAQSLGILENMMGYQRQAINRVHAGLQEAPPNILGSTLGQVGTGYNTQSAANHNQPKNGYR